MKGGAGGMAGGRVVVLVVTGGDRWREGSYCGRWLSCDGGRWLERGERLLNRDNCFSSGEVFKQSRGNEFLVHIDYMLEYSKDHLLEFGIIL